MFIKAIEDPKTVMIPINQMRGRGIECDSKDSIDKVVASHHAKVIVFTGLNLHTHCNRGVIDGLVQQFW
jgi:hypothetical protein